MYNTRARAQRVYMSSADTVCRCRFYWCTRDLRTLFRTAFLEEKRRGKYLSMLILLYTFFTLNILSTSGVNNIFRKLQSRANLAFHLCRRTKHSCLITVLV